MNETIRDYMLNMNFVDYVNMLVSITIIVSFFCGITYMVYHFFYYKYNEVEIDNELEHKITVNSILHH
jgi:hypothetical protein